MPNSDLLDYLMLQQLSSGGGAVGAQVWLQVALLVCLFGVGVFRPDVVRAKPLFRLACVLFALSLLISPTLNFLLSYFLRPSGSGPGYPRVNAEMALLLSFPSIISSVLFALSLVCGLCSLGLGGAAHAANKPPQPLARLTPFPAAEPAPASTANPPPAARGGTTGGVHPLDEPD